MTRTSPPRRLRASRSVLCLALLLAPSLWSTASHADYQRTWTYLTTGNGFGFQVYDLSQQKIDVFLDHPYRYVSADPSNPMDDGIGRRNMIYDFYFGVRGSTSGWLQSATVTGDPAYLDGTNIIHTSYSVGSIAADTYYFAPFGFSGNVMVALLYAPSATDGVTEFNFHMGQNAVNDGQDANGENLIQASDGMSEVLTGPNASVPPTVPGPRLGRGAMVFVPLNGLDYADCVNVFNKISTGLDEQTACSGDNIVPGFQRSLSATGGWMAVAMAYTDYTDTTDTLAQQITAWVNKRPPAQILMDAQTEFSNWRKPPPASVTLSADEAMLWRQSEAVLRMGQILEPYSSSPPPNTLALRNNGMILASLPPGEWHTSWVRDGSYASVALSRSGHFTEAREELDFILGADPVGAYSSYVNNQDYRVSVCRYYGDGSEQADYSGQPTPNVETDGWGLFMWAARQYVDNSGDVAWLSSQTRLGVKVYDAIAQGVATALEGDLETDGLVRADSSIWEVHDANKKHFTYTSLAAVRGFCDMATLAARAGVTADVQKWRSLSSKVATAVFQSDVDQNGALAGSVEGLEEGVYQDASVVEAFNWDLLPSYTGQTATATLNLLNMLQVVSGGYKRNNNNMSDYDNNEWILIDLRMSDALRRAGQTTPADALVSLVVQKAAVNFYLLPELYDAVDSSQIGAYTGSIPMVGYGAGAFLMTMLDRAGLYEPSDCGTSVLTDAGVRENGDGGGVSLQMGGGLGADIPYVAACLCQAGPGAAIRRHWELGTGLLLGAPWLLVGLRLILRRRRSA